MNNATRQAIQASSAVVITLLLAYIFPLDRALWATLTVIMLISSSFGESVKKASERMGMTLVGGIVATALYYLLLKHHPTILIIFLLLSVGFFVYFLAISYAWSSFFITTIVVFLFALLSYWDVHWFIVRSYETLIGAIIVVIVSGLVFPIKSQKNVADHYLCMLDKAEDFIDDVFSCLVMPSEERQTSLTQWHETLYTSWQQLKGRQNFVKFELAFSREKREEVQAYQAGFDVLFHYLTNILELLKKEPSPLCVQFENELYQVKVIIRENTTLLHQFLQGKKLDSEGQSLDDLRYQIRCKVAKLSQEGIIQDYREIERFYSLIYYSRKVNQLLLDLIKIEK
ncbi:FUSC family protein [Piscirickettsia salmonis]|uniref:FUSC family protein n=1 Tax=Piscirickettsia salmonis TaxID=1238 RepID=UPI0007C8D492|nr:Fusaric acid resistance protein family protein [Piscirickettsiaceae bacterium NZ-RLO1]